MPILSHDLENDIFYLPQLQKLAKKYVSTLSISVPTERLFSKAGELVSVKKSNEISK